MSWGANTALFTLKIKRRVTFSVSFKVRFWKLDTGLRMVVENLELKLKLNLKFECANEFLNTTVNFVYIAYEYITLSASTMKPYHKVGSGHSLNCFMHVGKILGPSQRIPKNSSSFDRFKKGGLVCTVLGSAVGVVSVGVWFKSCVEMNYSL